MLVKFGDTLGIVLESRRLPLDVLGARLDHYTSRQVSNPGPQITHLPQRYLNRVLRVDLQEDFSDLVIV